MNLTPENTMERILNGEDVTPSCRAEYFVKQAIDNAGGGGDEYETVAEIEVGEMTEQNGIYVSERLNANLPTDEILYFNTAEYEMRYVADSISYAYNGDDDGMPTGTPYYAIGIVSISSGKVVIASDTNAIENTTVRILKKASGGETITVDDALDDTSENPVQNKVITEAISYIAEDKANKGDLPLVVNGVTSGTSVTIVTEIKDIYNAAVDGRDVLLDTNIGQQMIRFNLYGYAYDETNDEYSCGFSMLAPDPNTANVMRVTFEQSSKTGTLTMHGIAYV